MQTIVSGRGLPEPWLIDPEGRGVVRADIIPHPQHHAFVHENMFFVPSCVILQTTDETNLLFFKNQSSEVNFEFYVTQFSADANVDMYFRFDSTYSSGGVIVTPTNSNRGSLNSIPTNRATIYDGGTSANLVLVHSSADPWHQCYLGSRLPSLVDFQGALMIGNEKTVSISAKGAIGTKVCALTMVSWHESGSHL